MRHLMSSATVSQTTSSGISPSKPVRVTPGDLTTYRVQHIMKHCLLNLALLAILASACCSCTGMSNSVDQTVRARFEDVDVSAEEIDVTLSGELVASGNVVLTTPNTKLICPSVRYDHRTGDFGALGGIELCYQPDDAIPILLTAEAITGNRLTGDIEARGSVLFRQGEHRSLTGSSFVYNFAERTGTATDAYSVVDGIYFSGKSLELDVETYRITGAKFSTCNRIEDPHYFLSARELQVTPGKDLTARRVGLNLWGAQLFVLPRYWASLSPDRKPAVRLPTIGASEQLGLFASYGFVLTGYDESTGSLDISLSAKQPVYGELYYDRLAGLPVFTRLSYRQPHRGGARPDLLISRAPEIGIRLCEGEEAPKLMTSKDFPLLAADTINPFEESKAGGELNTIVEIGLARFSEMPTGVTSNRADARFAAWLPVIQLDSQTLYSPGLSARVSAYSSGETYSTLSARLGVARKLSGGSFLSLSYITTTVSGRTPFAFDALELTDELAGKAVLSIGEHRFEVGGRYDLTQGKLFDWDLTFARTYHCLEPSVSWRNRHKELSLNLRVVGF